jgi:hypothetical protein
VLDAKIKTNIFQLPERANCWHFNTRLYVYRDDDNSGYMKEYLFEYGTLGDRDVAEYTEDGRIRILDKEYKVAYEKSCIMAIKRLYKSRWQEDLSDN